MEFASVILLSCPEETYWRYESRPMSSAITRDSMTKLRLCASALSLSNESVLFAV